MWREKGFSPSPTTIDAAVYLLHAVDRHQHVDEARDEAVAIAHVVGHHRDLVRRFRQERRDGQLLGHVGVVAQVLARILDGELGGAVIVRQRHVDEPAEHHRSGTARHHDVLHRLHVDAGLGRHRDRFRRHRRMRDRQEIVDELQLMRRAHGARMDDGIGKALQHRTDARDHVGRSRPSSGRACRLPLPSACGSSAYRRNDRPWLRRPLRS